LSIKIKPVNFVKKITPIFEIINIPINPRKFLFLNAFFILKNVSLIEITGSLFSSISLFKLLYKLSSVEIFPILLYF